MKRSPSAFGEPGGPPGICSPWSKKIFRAGAAGPRVAHRPEIVAGGDADDALVRQTGDRLPQAEGFVVVVINGDGEALLGQAEVARQQAPGVFDRAVLEIVAERKVAKHFEERVVASSIADVVQVVVLAPGAHALLRGGGAKVRALLDAGEDVLELDHAGVGEHQGRVVARDERTRRDDLMPVLCEELQEVRSNLVDAAHEHDASARFSRALSRAWPQKAPTGIMLGRRGRPLEPVNGGGERKLGSWGPEGAPCALKTSERIDAREGGSGRPRALRTREN